MKSRYDYTQAAPGAYKAMLGLEQYLHECGLEVSLIHLIKLRASQLNGCAFCLQYHILQSETLGVPADKINLVAVWREAPQFSPRERAALAWTEALTVLSNGVSDEVFAQASAQFTETELLYLTSAIASINTWNRFGAAYRWTPPPRRQRAAAAAS